jgi:hypothetical protein
MPATPLRRAPGRRRPAHAASAIDTGSSFRPKVPITMRSRSSSNNNNSFMRQTLPVTDHGYLMRNDDAIITSAYVKGRIVYADTPAGAIVGRKKTA